jgi:hypothetical protein
MAMYGIMRVEKRKRQALPNLEAEANRTADNPIDLPGSNINWTKTKDNMHLVETHNWWEHIEADINEAGAKIKKDSIVMLDGLYTASPEFFKNKSNEEIEKYFQDCLQFHINTYCHGDASLLKNAVVHMDEGIDKDNPYPHPHMQVASIPLTEDKRLSAKQIMGGVKAYCMRQDAFFEQVSKKYGLERGETKEHGSQRKHQQQAAWKAIQAEERAEKAEAELETVTKALNASKGELKATEEASKDILDTINDYNELNELTGKEPEDIEAKLNVKKRRKLNGDIVYEIAEEAFEKLVKSASINDKFNVMKKKLKKKEQELDEVFQKGQEHMKKQGYNDGYSDGKEAGIILGKADEKISELSKFNIEDEGLDDNTYYELKNIEKTLKKHHLTLDDLPGVKEYRDENFPIIAMIDRFKELKQMEERSNPLKSASKEEWEYER